MKTHEISAQWRIELAHMRQCIKTNDISTLQECVQRAYDNKNRALKNALKWAVYYGNIQAVTILLQLTCIDHWHNALYHAVYHDQHVIRGVILDHINNA